MRTPSRAAGIPARVGDVECLLPWFRSAGPDLAAMAAEITACPDQAPLVLERARRRLLLRLHDHSDDFEATAALHALTQYSAQLGSDLHRNDAERLIQGGLSGVDRLRSWRPWR